MECSSTDVFVIELDVSGCARFGLDEFYGALENRGIRLTKVNHWKGLPGGIPVLLIGTAGNRRVQLLLSNAGLDWRLDPESVILKNCCLPGGGKALLISGTDSAGLMYNLLELARRTERRGIGALSNAEDLIESPQNRVRCVDRYLLGHLDNEWFFSEKFWHYLLSRMARARFNRFCLIIGFDTPWMAPPYPYFMEMPDYPDVYVKNFDTGMRAENLAALRLIGSLCHRYGMQFVFASWSQRPSKNKDEQTVMGLPEDVAGLGEFCYKGLKALIAAVPEIDVIQFRVNHESGVGTQISAEDFWNRCADAVADAAAETGRSITLDLRAKGMTDGMVDHAFSLGLPVEVATKFWCEHAALPYHLSVMRTEELERLDDFNFSRRYSYADMLRKPRYYDIIFRLWNYGSTNLFIWGDADYARRFSLACGLSGSAGFQINTPLALKYNHEPWHKEAWHTFAKEELRYGDWEDERYWMWYTVYGRLGYNPGTDPSVWQDEFAARFGEAGESLEKALAAASKIVPLITAIHMPVHPSNTYWSEMSTGYSLFLENNSYKVRNIEPRLNVSYGSTEPSDQGLFYGADEYAKDLAAGEFRGKYTPFQTAGWLEDLAETAESLMAGAESLVKDRKSPEYLAMKADLSLLGDLARYHAEKLRAATALALWRITGDNSRLSDAALLFDRAIAHWEALARKGRENYYPDLVFGSRGSLTRRGSWADLSPELLADRASLADLLKTRGAAPGTALSGSYREAGLPVERSQLAAAFPQSAEAGRAIAIRVKASGFKVREAAPLLHYRHTDQTEGLFRTVEMKSRGPSWEAEIPADYVSADWDIQVYVTVQGPCGDCVMLPGVYHPEYPFPYHVIRVDGRAAR
ncbi:MAG: hypothetical protein LBH26_05540 [Treponema sp.]|jgi:hypothetical protein|nr:hypothetical protein [Treponema sp.]